MNPKWTKVYSGPGYPIDPKKEQQRFYENIDLYRFNPPDPSIVEAATKILNGIEEQIRCFEQFSDNK